MLIRFLADRPEAVPILASWFHDEWGRFDGRSRADIEAYLLEHISRGCLPVTFLLEAGSQIVGTVSLDASDLPPFYSVSSWLASLFVLPQARCQGIGTTLIHHAQQFALNRGLRPLYLWTTGSTRLYARCGWATVVRKDYHSHQVTVMQFRGNIGLDKR